jgi:hypothetical protein
MNVTQTPSDNFCTKQTSNLCHDLNKFLKTETTGTIYNLQILPAKVIRNVSFKMK